MTVSGSARIDASRRLFARARELMPGGVNSPVRAFSAVGGTPLFIARGHGPYVVDVDGNRYVDYVMSWGPLVHGHAFPPVIEAIEEVARQGTSFGAPSELEVELAELVVDAVPSVEMVRFVNSGTEAAMSAVRLARGATGRDVVVKFAGNYHGHADFLLADAGSGGLTFGVPSSPGVPEAATTLTLVLPYNDVPAVERAFAERGEEIAAVIVEPIAGNMGVVPPGPGFLEAIRDLTSRTGSIFICDEVITGFRVALGGAQSLYGFSPDLTVLGKIIGGGLPVGAYGGARALLEQLSPAGPIYQAGTLSGNPIAMAAGRASVKALKAPDFYSSLRGATEYLASGLGQAARDAPLDVTINWVAGMLTVFFSGGEVDTLADVQLADTSRFAQFFHAMLRQGVLLPPSQFEAWMVSAAHSREVLDRTVEAAHMAFTELAQGED